MLEDTVEKSFLSMASRVGANNRFIFLATDPDHHDKVSKSHQGFKQYLSTVIGHYFDQKRQTKPDSDPIDWYADAVQQSIDEYFKEDGGMIIQYGVGKGMTKRVLTQNVFNRIYPVHEDSSWANYRPSDEDFQLWEDNFEQFFKSDQFAIHTGEISKEDGVEKEQIGLCPAESLAIYMIRTGYKLIIDHLNQNTLDGP